MDDSGTSLLRIRVCLRNQKGKYKARLSTVNPMTVKTDCLGKGFLVSYVMGLPFIPSTLVGYYVICHESLFMWNCANLVVMIVRLSPLTPRLLVQMVYAEENHL